MADEPDTPETEGVEALPEGESPEAALPEGESPEAIERAETAEAIDSPEADAVEQEPAPEPAPDPVLEAPEPEVEVVVETEPVVEAEVEYVEERAPREKPAVPGADLEVDIVPEGVDPLAAASIDPYAEYDQDEPAAEEELEDVVVAAPIEAVAIDLAAGARYSATGKRKSAIARVTLRPGSGSYLINGRTLAEYFPRETLQRNIRQPLETVGYEERMDVVARMHGGGVSSQAGALRHGISRALTNYEPELRPILKLAGFLTRDSRVVERKKYGRAKARRSFQFSKR